MTNRVTDRRGESRSRTVCSDFTSIMKLTNVVLSITTHIFWGSVVFSCSACAQSLLLRLLLPPSSESTTDPCKYTKELHTAVNIGVGSGYYFLSPRRGDTCASVLQSWLLKPKLTSNLLFHSRESNNWEVDSILTEASFLIH